MSLWLQSLEVGLNGCEECSEKRAKCILAHLSMTVPRSWWGHALQTTSIPDDSYIRILRDLRTELLKISGPTEQIEFGLLVALAFIDENIEDRNLEYGTIYSQHSVTEYLTEAKKILKIRHDLIKLGEKIKRKAKLLD